MLCKIAELTVEVPEAGGMAPRCQAYRYIGNGEPDIVLNEHVYRYHIWPYLSNDDICYLESGFQFYTEIMSYNGMMLHSSAIAIDNRAYLFSGASGMGKSTHTRLWQKNFGEAAQNINDDKPALRKVDGKWYAYGTPWCGKDGINQNKKVPLAGICFLQRGEENSIRRMTRMEAIRKVIAQTKRKLPEEKWVELMLKNVEQLTADIPVFELHCNMEPEAAYLSYNTMRRTAEEMGL